MPEIAFLHALAEASSSPILRHFRRPLQIDNKESRAFDPVTQADREAERVMRDMIAAAHPGHAVTGEEFGVSGGGGEFEWLLDPIDGTRAFIMGLPLWGTLIGLERRGAPYWGMMNQPFTGERFWSDGVVARCRSPIGETEMRVRPCADIGDAIVTSTTPDMFAAGEEREGFARIERASRMRRFGGDCYAYCLLAMGQLDLVVECGLQRYDISPLIPIIREAGGVVTDWRGGDAAGGGRVVACGDARLHRQALDLLNG